MRVGKDFLLIHANRLGEGRRYRLDEIQSIPRLHEALTLRWPGLRAVQIDEALAALENGGLIIVENNRHRSLPTRAAP